MKHSISFLLFYVCLALVVCLGTWVRVTQLSTHMILFGDAGRDLLVATKSLQAGELPLLGIPSSVPRFKQGPLTIWYEMFVISVFGNSVTAVGVSFAIVSCIALIFLYELTVLQLHKPAALVSTVLFAMSPLAVAHARMPYHITPIPLMVLLYLAALIWWWMKPSLLRMSMAVLSFWVLFQFELNTIPLILLIPYVWFQLFKKRLPTKKEWSVVGVSTVFGLLPQLVHDVTHRFEQVGLFVAWLVYRSLGFLKPGGGHGFSLSQLSSVATLLYEYGTKVFAFEKNVFSIIFLSLIVIVTTLSAIYIFQKKSQPKLVVLATIANVVLVLSYIVHGAPSEAYIPPFLVLWPILLGYGTFLLPKQALLYVFGFLLLWLRLLLPQFAAHNWFVDTDKNFSYGASVSQQQEILSFISKNMNANSVSFKTTTQNSVFPAYFDNIRWLSSTNPSYSVTESATGHILILDPLSTDVGSKYPGAMCMYFKTTVLCKVPQ